MRHWISLIENAQEYEYLYWFWFRPSDNTLHHVDGTHTTSAFYELGYERELFPHEREEGLNIEDDEIIGRAIADGWVRGRYGYRKRANGMAWGWNGDQKADPNCDLSLQGQPRDVWKAALWIAQKWPFKTLYVDFNTDHDSMDSAKLTGDRLEFYLKRGTVPRDTVVESNSGAAEAACVRK